MKLRETLRHLTAIPPLMRGEVMMATCELRATVHRTGGAVFPGDPADQEELRAWLAQFPAEHMGVVSRKKVTGAFVTNLVANMCGTASDIAQYRYHDAGTGVNAEANTDVALQTEISSPTTRATGTQVAGGTAIAPTYQTVATLGPLPTATITEHIIATTAARTTTSILDRSVFSASPIASVSGDYWTADYTVTFNAEA